MSRGRKYPPARERLEARLVNQPSGCREFSGSRRPVRTGYGLISDDNGKVVGAHILAWTLAHGPIPPGMKVLHHCDNPPCCQAYGTDHLFLGTDADNSEDRAAKGRGYHQDHLFCPQGHLYDGTYTRPGFPRRRRCADCDRETSRLYQAARRARIKAAR
jgi:hypothetical protein